MQDCCVHSLPPMIKLYFCCFGVENGSFCKEKKPCISESTGYIMSPRIGFVFAHDMNAMSGTINYSVLFIRMLFKRIRPK